MSEQELSAEPGQGEIETDDPVDYDIDDVLAQLQRVEGTVTGEQDRQEIERTRQMLERVPGSNYIRKYTSRDAGEALVGGIVFSLPLLVEDGVFEIAEWMTGVTLGGVPVLLVANVLLVVALTTGVLYAVDFREVKVTNPFFGVVPRRLVAVLAISFAVAATTMLLWGRLHEEDPTALERFARITVIWAAAALGATLGDILPGESRGEDLGNIIE